MLVKVKYPNITVKLVGSDGNAFAIMGKIQSALRKNKVPQTEIDECMEKMMSGDYNNLLRTAMEYVNVE